jgi:hypothetical protein
MSRHWDLYCVDCDEEFGFDWNHGEERLLDLLEVRFWFEACPNLSWASRIDVGTTESLIRWFKKHEGHTVTPRDEYGVLYGKCRERVKCGACSAQHRCVLKEGHSGECRGAE